MRLTRARAYLAAGMVAAAGITTGVAVTAAQAAPAASQVVIVSCTGHGVVKPSGNFKFCNASNEFLTGLKWTSWRSVAFGGGTLKVNNCVPSCANGNFVSYPILTVGWRAEPRPRHPGQRYFSRLTMIFTGKVPNHGPAAQTVALLATGR